MEAEGLHADMPDGPRIIESACVEAHLEDVLSVEAEGLHAQMPDAPRIIQCAHKPEVRAAML